MSAVFPGTGNGERRRFASDCAQAGGPPSCGPLTRGGTLAWRRPSLGAFIDVLGISGGRLGLKRKEDPLWLVLISLCTLATWLGLYNLRTLDDNRLSSWWWVFDGDSPCGLHDVLS